MKNRKLLLNMMLIIPWVTIPLLGRRALKRFLPNAIFITIINKLLNVYGVKRKWWRHYKGIGAVDSTDFVILGPFFASSLWMLKKTYGNFLHYFIFNKLLHIIYILGGVKVLKREKVFSLKKLTKLHYLLILFLRGLLLYLFQYIYEKLKRQNLNNTQNTQ